MPRQKPPWRRFGQIDFDSMIPFDSEPNAPALGVNDILPMRRADGGGNLLVTVGDIQAHGGAVDISDLTGGANDDMLYRTGGIWTGSGATGLKYNGTFLQIPDGSAGQPGLAFAGASTSGFLRSGSQVQLSLVGTSAYLWGTTFFATNIGAGPRFMRRAATAVIPTVVWNGNDDNSGAGSAGDDKPTWIAGGVEAFRTVEIGGGVIPAPAADLTITAFAGGGQASATALKQGYNVVTVVATDGDSTRLPDVFDVNSIVYVKNDGANSMDIFPASGDNLGNGVDTAEACPAGGFRAFIATTANAIWTQLLPTPATTAFPEFLFYADQMDNPVNADWDVNALAPAVADSNNAALTVRLFDDTVQEGAGIAFKLPPGATAFELEWLSRAETAPGAAAVVKPAIEIREIPDNSAVTAPPWTSLNLVDTDIPTNEFFQYDSQSITFASLALTAGNYVQLEFTRNPTHPNDNLTGDWAVLSVRVSFT